MKLVNAFLGHWLIGLAIGLMGLLWFVVITLAGLILDKPLTGEWRLWLLLATGLWCVVSAVLKYDHLCFMREHLAAERRLTKACWALQACAEVISDRADRGARIYGTPLHATALALKGRALEAMKVAQRFRERRDGKV